MQIMQGFSFLAEVSYLAFEKSALNAQWQAEDTVF